MKSALLHYLRTVLGSQDLGEVFARHFNAIDSLVGADGYAIYLLDADRGTPRQTAAEGVPDTFLESYEELGREEDLLLNGALDRRAPFHDRMIGSRAEWTDYARMMKVHGYSHAMVAPLPYNGEILGTINFIRRGSAPFRATEGRTTQMAAEFLGIAVGHALEHGAVRARARAAQWAASKLPGAMVIASGQRELLLASDAIRDFGEGSDDELLEALIDASVEAAHAARGSRRPQERSWRGGIIRSVSLPEQEDVALAMLIPATAPRPRFDALRGLLTAREIEVLEHAASGLHDKEIATTLNVSVYTVKQHLKNAYAKLGVRSRTEAADKAYGARGPDAAEGFLRSLSSAQPAEGDAGEGGCSTTSSCSPQGPRK